MYPMIFFLCNVEHHTVDSSVYMFTDALTSSVVYLSRVQHLPNKNGVYFRKHYPSFYPYGVQ